MKAAARWLALSVLLAFCFTVPFASYALRPDQLPYLVIGGLWLVCACVLGVCFDWFTRWKRESMSSMAWFRALPLALVVVVPFMIFEWLYEVFLVGAKRASDAGTGAAAMPMLLFVLGVTVFPFLEELVFRAWPLSKVWLGRFLSVRILFASAAFAAAHVWLEPGAGAENLQRLALFPMDLLFAFAMVYIWYRTRSLFACVFAHALNNAFALWG